MGGENGCRRIFEGVLAKGYSDPAFGKVHLITVDAYALQHGDAHGPQSNAYHLVRLCAIVEFGASPAIGLESRRAGGKCWKGTVGCRKYILRAAPDR